MKLLTEYFKSSNPQRDKEYSTCIQENLKNTHIDEIIIFISDDSTLELKSPKIKIVNLQIRPTFKYLFEYCNDNFQNQKCIIANTDIFFDESLSHFSDFVLENKFISLTRWDLLNQENKWYLRFYDFPWRKPDDEITTAQFSQDAWIFQTPFKNDDRLDFLMGRPGCDNRISQIVHENGYDVRNPSKQIIIKHLHLSNHRTYTNQDIVPGPYLLIKPTTDINIISEKFTIPHF
jgi:hypothetical protein